MKADLMHVGLTASDFEKTAAFYQKYFGFELEFKIKFDESFFEDKRCLYDLNYGNYSYVGFLKSPNGFVVELFEFKEQSDKIKAKWNRPGYHHICLWVDDVEAKCEELKRGGVELFFEPEYKNSQTDEKWTFLRDPDGNLIELNGL